MLHTEILLPHTPAMQQGGTASCWAFSMCSYWETEEAIARGDSLVTEEFSPWYLARLKLQETSDAMMSSAFRKPQKLPNGAMAQTAIGLRQLYGITHLSDYQVGERGQGKNYSNLRRCIQLLTWVGQYTVIFRPLCRYFIKWLLDDKWGSMPDPSVVIDRSFRAPTFYTSFSHLPYQQDVLLSLPDNYQEWKLHNLPLDTLIVKMRQTLQEGHSLLWQGCLRQGFSVRKGIATLPPSTIVSEQQRSANYLDGTLTDDHMMHIIGLAHDESGQRYFICKNSVGDIGPYHGLVYMSEDYVRMNTIAVGI